MDERKPRSFNCLKYIIFKLVPKSMLIGGKNPKKFELLKICSFQAFHQKYVVIVTWSIWKRGLNLLWLFLKLRLKQGKRNFKKENIDYM